MCLMKDIIVMVTATGSIRSIRSIRGPWYVKVLADLPGVNTCLCNVWNSLSRFLAAVVTTLRSQCILF